MSKGPVDLGRVRRGLQKIERTLREHPEVAERTGRMLAGELACHDLEDEMSMDLVPIRLPAGVVARADALIEPMAADPKLAALGTVTKAVVLRVALVRGLEALEAEYQAAGDGPRHAARPRRSK